MSETKPKQANVLRTPKPKKKLGLSVPPALRLPHDDLIIPLADSVPQITSNSSQTGSMPSLTSLTRHTPQISLIDDIAPNNTPVDATMTSLTSLTSHSHQEDNPISPTRDFTKVANSIGRQAVPAGLFTGKSKQLYDCLYSLTRGAIIPARSVRISRPKLMKKSGIGSRVTFDANVERLTTVGLIIVRQITGEHEGNEYAVFLPEELSESMPSQTSQTSTSSLTGYAQKLGRLVRLETSQTRHSLSDEFSTTYDMSKTSFKTLEKNDDEAFVTFVGKLREVSKEITGVEPDHGEQARWGEVADILVTELREAASKTKMVASVPAFLAAHLKRKFVHRAALTRDEPKLSTSEDAEGARSEQGRKLTTEEIAEQSRLITELLEGGYTLDQAREQFSGSFHPDDWEEILGRHKLGHDPERS